MSKRALDNAQVGAALLSVALMFGAQAVFSSAASAQKKSDPTRETAVPEELFEKAKQKGSVRVIVQLRIPTGPEETREQAIQQTQQMLLKELARVSHRVVRTYTAIPAIALEASLDALRLLAASRHVLRVDEDKLLAPLKECADSPPAAGNPKDPARCK